MNHLTIAARGLCYRQLPLWRDAQHLLLEVELAIHGFVGAVSAANVPTKRQAKTAFFPLWDSISSY